MNWRCRSTTIFAIIFLNFEIYCAVPKKLGDILFHIVSPQTMSYIAEMQYMYYLWKTLFHTAILGGEGTVMKISTKCNRCDLFQTMSKLSERLDCSHTDWFCMRWAGVHLIYLNRNQDSKSWFWFTVSNRVDHTRYMILSESIIQDGEDGVLHRFIWANQKYDSETSKSYSVQVSKRIKYIPWIIQS